MRDMIVSPEHVALTDWGMSHAEYLRMQKWCTENHQNPKVLDWLRRNPPPDNWDGTPTEWAYEEMVHLPAPSASNQS